MASAAHTSVVVLVCLLYLSKSEGRYEQERDTYCPDDEKHGRWEHQYKDGDRCVLKCAERFKPSGCHVIRKPDGSDWAEGELPTCIEASGGFPVSGKTLAIFGTGVAAVAMAPLSLPTAVISVTSVLAGSVAEWLQGSATEPPAKVRSTCEEE